MATGRDNLRTRETGWVISIRLFVGLVAFLREGLRKLLSPKCLAPKCLAPNCLGAGRKHRAARIRVSGTAP